MSFWCRSNAWTIHLLHHPSSTSPSPQLKWGKHAKKLNDLPNVWKRSFLRCDKVKQNLSTGCNKAFAKMSSEQKGPQVLVTNYWLHYVRYYVLYHLLLDGFCSPLLSTFHVNSESSGQESEISLIPFCDFSCKTLQKRSPTLKTWVFWGWKVLQKERNCGCKSSHLWWSSMMRWLGSAVWKGPQPLKKFCHGW